MKNKHQHLLFTNHTCDYCGQDVSVSFYYGGDGEVDYFCCLDCGLHALLFDGNNTYHDAENDEIIYHHVKFLPEEIFDGYYKNEGYITTSELVNFLQDYAADFEYWAGPESFPYNNFRVIENTLFSSCGQETTMYDRAEEKHFDFERIAFISTGEEASPHLAAKEIGLDAEELLVFTSFESLNYSFTIDINNIKQYIFKYKDKQYQIDAAALYDFLLKSGIGIEKE